MMKRCDLNSKLALACAIVGAFALASSAGAADLDGGYKDVPAPAPSYFTDDTISFRYGTAFKEPGVNNGNDIEKGILNLNHINTDKWGSNFFDLDILFSTGKDPVNNITAPFSPGGPEGATEAYLVMRRYLSYSGITNTNVSNSFISDFGLNVGGDFGTKNDPFSEEKRSLVIGPRININVPVGFWFIAVDAYHEWNHNGFCNCATEFGTTFDIESAWAFPFKIGESAFLFKGFFTLVAPKGDNPNTGNPGDIKTKTEILTRPELLLDVGNYFGAKNKFEVGFGYEYWLNKFGNNHDALPGSLANTPELIARYHF